MTKKTNLNLFLAMVVHLLVLLICTSATFATGTYDDGDGSVGNPFQINTPTQMDEIGQHSEDWGSYFLLTANIDLSAYTGTAFHIIGTYYQNPFTGSFDGDGYTISNFTYTPGGNFVGLFGYTTSGCEIKNLGMVNVNVDAGNYTGGLVGLLEGSISNCSVDGGSVSGSWNVGGLVGKNNFGTVSNCYTTSSVSGVYWVGGLVGYNSQSTISDCYATGSVSGTGNVGGLLGTNSIGTVSNCYSSGLVSGSSSVGGLIGGGFGAVYLSYWNTETSGQGISAGGSGKTTAEMMLLETYRGWGFGSFWNLDEGNDYPRLAWESAGGILITDEIRNYGGGNGEPNNPYQLFTPEQLATIGWYQQDFDKHFILMDDLNLSVCDPNDWAIIGNQNVPFTGTFEGSNHTISNFTYNNNSSYIGLFGCVDNGGEIKNLGFVDPNIDAGFGWYVGGLVGELYDGEILNCFVEGGSVSGHWSVGSLVGVNYYGTISNSYATGGVSGDSWIGGLVGWHWNGIVSNCYASGAVSGDERVGGLVGQINGTGTITNCYASSSVSGTNNFGGLVGQNLFSAAVTMSFWDVNTSGQATSDGGTGKTTAEMQMRSTFTDAGWDFCGETANGTEYIWNMFGDGLDYPELTCFTNDTDGDCVPDDSDNCQTIYNPGQEDDDSDGLGNVCDPCPGDPDDDGDSDGVCGDIDNCPDTTNPGQEDSDGDGVGNVCDICLGGDDNIDSDSDGVPDYCDSCPNDPDDDADSDGVCGDIDNCPDTANPGQEDDDSDGVGNACDSCPNDPNDDVDSDGVCGDVDNCPDTANPVQTDSDGDGIGDDCECQAANLDGINPVNLGDFAILAYDWLATGSSLAGDTNRDESVDVIDIEQVAQHWLSDCNPP